MCTVVTQWGDGESLRILAIRDEFVGREFDDPDEWWPRHPGVIGGRDRSAGGSWCVSDVASGVTALVLNRPERRTGTPSRGVLPIAGVEHGEAWPEHVEHHDMAAFTLVLAGPTGVSAWTWDAAVLAHHQLSAGMHVFTSAGIDADDEKTARLTPKFATQPWLDVATAEPPSDDRAALIVTHEVPGTDGAADAVYATVFGQTITSRPATLQLAYSRTPWIAEGWTTRTVSAPGARSPAR